MIENVLFSKSEKIEFSIEKSDLNAKTIKSSNLTRLILSSFLTLSILLTDTKLILFD